MNQKLKTSIAYTKNLLVTGAITKTSRNVEIEICKYLPITESKVIVEFGAGHGNITRQILDTISPTSILYAFEVNKSFCKHLEQTICDSRLKIINAGAENVKQYVKQPVDAVISSLPFSFFGKKKGLNIIQDAYDLIENNGYYSQVLYTKFNFKKFKKIFDECYIVSNNNAIKEHIFHCKKSLK